MGTASATGPNHFTDLAVCVDHWCIDLRDAVSLAVENDGAHPGDSRQHDLVLNSGLWGSLPP